MVLLNTLPDHITRPQLEEDETYVMPTVRLKVHAGRETDYIRGVFGWASEYNMISEKCRKRFNLPLFRQEGVPTILSVSGFLMDVFGHSQITVSSHLNDEFVETLQVLVARNIKGPVYANKLHPVIRGNLASLELADPILDQHVDVDLIIGEPTIRRLTKSEIRCVLGSTFYAIDTHFGWIVMGKAPTESLRVVAEQRPFLYLY